MPSAAYQENTRVNLLFLVPGLIVAALGFVLLFGLLISQGALDKSKQFGALSGLASGEGGALGKVLLALALLMMGLGACGVFAGVAASDAGRSRACTNLCKQKGYTRGSIGGSKALDPQNPRRHAFVACTCTGGPNPTPLETRADDLPGR